MKVTPAHDPNDFETGQRHKLPMISIFDEAGIVNAEGGAFAGLDRFEARKAVKARAEGAGPRARLEAARARGRPLRALRDGRRADAVDAVVREDGAARQAGHRGGGAGQDQVRARELVEDVLPLDAQHPRLVHLAAALVGPPHPRRGTARSAARSTVARTTPRRLRASAAPARAEAGRGRARHLVLVVAVAVLDARLADETRELKTFYPTTVLDTGYDILFFWVARMIMAGLHFMKKVPFRTVYLHTMVTDEKGDKMSKVKGNTIDPLDVIEQHGADALRFALAWLTTPAAQGKNIKFSMSNVEDARRFANKIWNATRFAQMNLEGYDADRFADWMADGPDRAELDLPERWILSRVQRVVEEVDTALEEYRIADAAQAAYHFVWNELCDWYIELAKAGFQRAGTGVEARSKIQGALVTALETSMRLLHPFMPFITEEIWQQLPEGVGRPAEHHDHALPGARRALPRRRVRVVDGARAEGHRRHPRHPRRERNIPTSGEADGAARRHRRLQEDHPRGVQEIIAEQARCGDVRVRRSGASFSGEFSLDNMAMAMAGDVEVMVPLEGLVDPKAELDKAREGKLKLESDIATTSRRSSRTRTSPSRAPPRSLDKDRAKLAELKAALAKLRTRSTGSKKIEAERARRLLGRRRHGALRPAGSPASRRRRGRRGPVALRPCACAGAALLRRLERSRRLRRRGRGRRAPPVLA